MKLTKNLWLQFYPRLGLSHTVFLDVEDPVVETHYLIVGPLQFRWFKLNKSWRETH